MGVDSSGIGYTKELSREKTREVLLNLFNFIYLEFKEPIKKILRLVVIILKCKESYNGLYYIPIKEIRKKFGHIVVKCILSNKCRRREFINLIIRYMIGERIAWIDRRGLKKRVYILYINPSVVRYINIYRKKIRRFIRDFTIGYIFNSEEEAYKEFIEMLELKT